MRENAKPVSMKGPKEDQLATAVHFAQRPVKSVNDRDKSKIVAFCVVSVKVTFD